MGEAHQARRDRGDPRAHGSAAFSGEAPGTDRRKTAGPMGLGGRQESARRVQRVIVATDSEKIMKAVRGFGGEAMMTSPRCASGTDRVAEVARATQRADRCERAGR